MSFFDDFSKRAQKIPPDLAVDIDRIKSLAPEDRLHEALLGIRLTIDELGPVLEQHSAYVFLGMLSASESGKAKNISDIFDGFVNVAATTHPEDILAVLGASIMWLDYFLETFIKPISEREHILIPTEKEKEASGA